MNNQLTKVDFTNLKYLENLNLMGNKIAIFTQKMFNPHNTLITLNLAENLISDLDLKFC